MDSVKEGIVNELHRPARKNYARRRVIIKGIDDLWQADLLELQPHAKDNEGQRYILIVIDCLSKFVWYAGLKTKTGKDVAQGFENILIEAYPRRPRHLQTDQGKEFYNRIMKSLLSKYGINHYSTGSNLKACIVERVIRTLKTWLWKEFGIRGSYKWIDIFFTKIVYKYNHRVHRSIGMKPAEVEGEEKEARALGMLYPSDNNSSSSSQRRTRRRRIIPKYHVGDFVRISKRKGDFEKGYIPSWSTEIFKIAEVRKTLPPTYILQDRWNNEDIKGGFYEEELQLTKYPDTYLIEKEIKKRGNKVYVKWLGFDSRHNSWVNTDRLRL